MPNSFKINILIFYLFLLFFHIKSKEMLEEWEDTTQNIINSSNPISSSTIFFAINNITNSKIYLDEKKIYIINQANKIIISLDNNLKIKSINSPLIEIDTIYYFCSSSSLYKIENEKLISIGINTPNDIEGKINSLKCFNHKNEKIIIGLIGANYIINYYLNKKDFLKKDKYKLLGNLIDINIYNINANIPYIAAISKNKNKYFLQTLTLENMEFINSYISYLSEEPNFEVSDKSNISISFLSEKIIIILSFIRNKEFKFYHFNFESNILELVGGKHILRQFKEYSLINAKFIENTPIIYYTITKNGRYFLGAADLQYYIILYNIEINNYMNITYDEGYYYQSKAFLNYFDNNTQKKICPFVLNGTLCQHKLEGKYFVISKEYSSYGLYKNYFSDSCPNGQILGHYCLEECPVGSSPSGQGSCFQCTYNVFYNYADKKCSDVCDYNHEYKICYDCEREDKIFYNNSCIDNCSDVYKLYDKTKNKCIECEKNKYFDLFKKECIDKCPDDNEIDQKNKVCIDCHKFNLYSLNLSGKVYCYKKCPLYYYQNNNTFKCEKCSPDSFYKNGECVDNCGDYSNSSIKINGNEIKYCQSCKELGKLESNGKCTENCTNNSHEENWKCVKKCNKGYILNNTNNKCESCLEKGLYYYEGTCKAHCSEFIQSLTWNEIDHICRNCSEINKDLYFQDNTCVEKCKEATEKKDEDKKICYTCQYPLTYYLNGKCNDICPKYSIANKIKKICSYCPDDTNFFKNKCIKDCKEPYIRKMNENNHYVCEICEERKWYTSGACKEECDNNCYKLEESHSCHFCFCNNKGNCNNNTNNECTCDIHYFGKSCDFYRKKPNNELKIIPLYNIALKSSPSFYKFNLEKNYTNYKIKWDYYLGKKEITSNPEYKKYFITGNKEEIFGINPNLLSEIKNNYLHLTLTSFDNKKILEDEIKITVQKLDIVSNHKVSFLEPKLQDSEYLYSPMINKIEIEQTEYSNMNQFKYYYQFSFLDENNEEIPLTNFDNPRSIETYYIPFAKQYIVSLKNDRGEIKKYEIKKDDSDVYKHYNYDMFTSKPIEEIIYDNKYNDIEKIFIFIYVFKSKEKILNEKEINVLFNFINEMYKNFINEKGYYNIDSDQVINYSEPKVLFSLINSIIISQKKILNYSYIDIILKSFRNKCLVLFNTNIKLSQKDIISLLRTIEQLHDAFKENIYLSELEKNSILTDFYYLLGKINFYLSSKLYPGEGIKIIGNRTVLFSYNLGQYEESLAISSNNLTSPANISDISSYSYENYGLNEEECGYSGETFLCIKKDLYEEIKNKLKENGYDTKNISINILIVNNIGKNLINGNYNENESDNYLVVIKFYDFNEKNIENVITDGNLFYSLEFSLKMKKRK